MKRRNVTGQVIGAVIGGGITLVILSAAHSVKEIGHNLFLVAVVIGAVFGSRLWKRIIQTAYCPHGGKMLRTNYAKQCFECGEDWH